MQKIVIGVAGRAQSGKGSVGKRLIEGMGYKEVRLADPMRRFIAEMLDIPFEAILEQGDVKESVRPSLQYIGTEVVREELPSLFPEVWPESAHAVSLRKRLARNPGMYVVTDIRYLDEMDELRKLQDDGWVVQFWLVQRPDFEGTLTPEMKAHSSEALFNREDVECLFDQVIVNDAGVDELDLKVEESMILLDSLLRIQNLRNQRKQGTPAAVVMPPSPPAPEPRFGTVEMEPRATNVRVNPKSAAELFPTSYTPSKSERAQEVPAIRPDTKNAVRSGVSVGNRHPNLRQAAPQPISPIQPLPPEPTTVETGMNPKQKAGGPTASRFGDYLLPEKD